MDVGLHRLPVTFVLDRAGVTGDDGASHNGMWDLSILSLVPGMRIALPSRRRRALSRSCWPRLLRLTTARRRSVFPKGALPYDIEQVDRIGGLDVLRRDSDADVLIVAFGPMAELALDVAGRLADQGISSTVLDPRWVLPVNPVIAGLAASSLFGRNDRRSRPSRRRGFDGGDGAARGRRHDSRAGAVDPAAVSCPKAKRGEVLSDIGLTAQEIARQVVESVAGIDALGQPQTVTD